MRRLGTLLTLAGRSLHALLVVTGGLGFTLLLFLVLPLMQALNEPPAADLALQEVSTAELEAPPPPPEEEPEEEPEPEEKPPELIEEAPPLDLSQLELALNPGGIGEGWLEGDFAVRLNTGEAGSRDVDELFSLSDLDQKPRVVYQPAPPITNDIRRKAPGTVYIIFVVDRKGRVENPSIQKSTDPVFDKAALNAVKQWKFEPGRRNGEPVRFRMRVPITFPKGL